MVKYNKKNLKKIRIESFHKHHPRIRAEDWRSPLVRRLSNNDVYKDGKRVLTNSFRSNLMEVQIHDLILTWSGLKEDFDRCIKTYQLPVITEFATLGLCCILLTNNLGLEITEVTRRSEKADYWLGDKEELIEISGQLCGSLSHLCNVKSIQLLSNPYRKSGYVCVANYVDAKSRLWYYHFDERTP